MYAPQGQMQPYGTWPPGYPGMPAAYPMPMGKIGKAPEIGTKGRRRRKKVLQGGPKKPATSFVLFSNTVREEVKAANPGLSFLELGKKLGEMWREMDPAVRKEYEDRATAAKDRYLEEKKIWLAQRAAGMTQD
ncbi:hypothetical protein GUITHDRAFT_115609 [Guillardia theta CCMP2712]|uniref:HMG box domain-containing protein n=1 Tax=Guillardia theta (strain CCMP2712) TaxID=905079 RepID=L1IQD8_GUITC|nr:hypothetical protein GUITHDRAFT_115609 [Guillardia theta CCMP2712]EKX38267.1 hypothetical protein GUITHDRAFT_115609 [Guillardia theta CCMP2712]|eukprot:XP_005825247.1 hypothetical protein GUITHDRAFT_115609 [Guillardia theta CCMP2712]